MTRTAIVSVGNELLYGQTVDTNAAWLGRTLTPLGLRVVRRYTVADVDTEIREAVGRAMEVADLVLVTGGLGPTPDDRTKGAVAAGFGRELVESEEALEGVRTYLRVGQAEVPDRLHSQTTIPAGAEVLRNERGTAPGLLLEERGRWVVLLPGVPGELRGIVADVLVPRLRDRGWVTGAAHHFVVHTTGCPESTLAEQVERLRAGVEPSVLEGIDLAYLPDEAGVDLRFTVDDEDPQRARERFEALEEALTPAWAPFVFEAASGDLAEALLHALRAARATVAVAESCTGGLVGKRLTDHAGSSDVVLGGVIAYADEVKVRDLGVPPALIAEHGAVSEPVARAMAEGAARHFGASASIALTGIAGPGGGTAEKPVGTVWAATSLGGVVDAFVGHFTGDRDGVRARAAQAAMASLYRRLLRS